MIAPGVLGGWFPLREQGISCSQAMIRAFISDCVYARAYSIAVASPLTPWRSMLKTDILVRLAFGGGDQERQVIWKVSPPAWIVISTRLAR